MSERKTKGKRSKSNEPNADAWMDEMCLHIKSRASAVSNVRTKDANRVDEVAKRFMAVSPYGAKAPSRVLKFDISEGIRVATAINDGTVKWEHIVTSDGQDFSQSRGDTQPFSRLAPIIYRELISTPTVLITNILANDQIDVNMLDVLTSWSQSDVFYNVKSENENGVALGSHIIVFTYDGDVLPHKVVNLCGVFTPPISTEKERRDIIDTVVSIAKFTASDNEVDEVIRATAGLNLRETFSAVLKSVMVGKRKNNDIPTFDMPTLRQYRLDALRKYESLIVQDAKHTFDEVGGYEPIKKFIRERFILPLKSKWFEEQGINPPKGLILYGVTGSGKTLIANCLAHELGIPMVMLNMDRIKKKYVGQSENNLRDTLEIIDQCGEILVFVDEVDRFGKRSSNSGENDGGTSRNLFSTLLEWLGKENRKAIMLGTTNALADMDDAMIRVGRFDYAIPQLYPDTKSRAEIIKVWTEVKREIYLGTDVNYDLLATMTDYYVGAELSQLVDEAVLTAFLRKSDKVEMRDFIDAINNKELTPPKNIRRDIIEKRYMTEARRFTSDRKLLADIFGAKSDTGNNNSPTDAKKEDTTTDFDDLFK